MSADAVLSLLRKRSADARLWVEAEEWLTKLQSLEGAAHEAKGRLDALHGEEDAVKQSIADLGKQREAAIVDIDVLKVNAADAAQAVRRDADAYANNRRDEGAAIVTGANEKAASILSGARSAADKLKVDTAASLADTLAAIDAAKADLERLTAEVADKHAALAQVNATLRAKLG